MTEVATPVEQPTEAEIQRHYSAALDSVSLLNAGKPEGMDETEWADCVKRNVDHLSIMVAKEWMQGQDLAPLNAAIEANKG
jgi:hypothetical protein